MSGRNLLSTIWGIPTVLLLIVTVAVALADDAYSSTVILTTLHGEHPGDQYGISIANAGDVNGDGYQDLLVGANLSDAGGCASGRCYLYLGGQEMDTLAALTITGAPGDRLGSRVAGGGDFNGDGFADFAVYSAGDSTSPGKVLVFFGSYFPDAVPDLILEGSGRGDNFGYALSLEGDLDGDGFSDLVVGAPGADSTGFVYIYFGSTAPDTLPDLVIRGETGGDYFGCSVSTAGDVDGDGMDDLVVGARLNSETAFWAGKVYVFSGGAVMDTIPDLEITGESMGDGFGSSVLISGDVNGDYYSDLIVGAPYFNTAQGTDAGKVYIYFGGPMLDASADAEIVGELSQDLFGYSIGAMDENGDGTGDVVVGAPNHPGSGVQFGKVYLYYGGSPFDTTCDYSDVGGDSLDGLGFSMASFERLVYQPDGSGQFASGAWNMDGRGGVRVYAGGQVTAGVDGVNGPDGFVVELFPNPSRGLIRMRLGVEREVEVRAELYDVAGRRVGGLVSRIGPGEETVDWNGGITTRRLPPGVYFLKVAVGGRKVTRKVLIMR